MSSLALSAVSNATISAVWSRPSSNGAPIQTYRVYACDAQSAGVCYATTVAATELLRSGRPAATLIGLPSGRNFTLLVDAENGVGRSGNRTLACASTPCVTTHAVPMRGNTPSKDEPLAGLPLATTILVTWVPPFANGLPLSAYDLVVDGVSQVARGVI